MAIRRRPIGRKKPSKVRKPGYFPREDDPTVGRGVPGSKKSTVVPRRKKRRVKRRQR